MTSISDPDQALPLLGGLTPQTFMRRHWQKKPLLIRQAQPSATAVLDRNELLRLARQEGVESRLIRQTAKGWSMRTGPFERRQLPAFTQKQWTLLVQGVDLHWPAAHRLLQQFRFIPDARLDDVMVSFAADGGGVGPHFDSYDVFLLQLQGRRRWRIGRLAHPQLMPGMPLKILTNFVAEQEWLLEPGDMLYLPPRWAHEGVAVGECLTASIGFRAASVGEFAREVLQRSLEALEDDVALAGEGVGENRLYRDPKQPATSNPACIPASLQAFAATAVQQLLEDPASLSCSLGEWLSEPKPGVWFEAGGTLSVQDGLCLNAKTRMLYDSRHLFINGESFRASGRDARLLRTLADARWLSHADASKFSDEARVLVQDWAQAGWLQPLSPGDDA